MSAGRYWPYDEVSLNINDSKTLFSIMAPWMTVTIDVNEENLSPLSLLTEKTSNQSLCIEDTGLLNWLFSDLKHFPFCYSLPQLPTAEQSDLCTLKDTGLLSLELNAFLSRVAQDFITENSLTLSLTNISQSLSLPRSHWDWDLEAAIEFAKVGDKIDPISLLSVARRYHLLDVISDNKARECFQEVSQLSGPEFALASALMLRQNHYVTEKCQQSLRPAIGNAGRAQKQVEDFCKEENGHDLILGAALKSVNCGQDPNALLVTSQSKILMHLLAFAAERNFLAFAMAIDAFERSSFEETDPLAKLLTEGGFVRAGKQVNRHKEINDAGDHENVAVTFLKYMAHVDPGYAQESLRIAELISLFMNSIATSALEAFKKTSAPK
jgi:hypothetical protein